MSFKLLKSIQQWLDMGGGGKAKEHGPTAVRAEGVDCWEVCWI